MLSEPLDLEPGEWIAKCHVCGVEVLMPDGRQMFGNHMLEHEPPEVRDSILRDRELLAISIAVGDY